MTDIKARAQNLVIGLKHPIVLAYSEDFINENPHFGDACKWYKDDDGDYFWGACVYDLRAAKRAEALVDFITKYHKDIDMRPVRTLRLAEDPSPEGPSEGPFPPGPFS